MRRHPLSGPLAVLLAPVLLGLTATASRAEQDFISTPSESKAPTLLKFGASLSRVEYRQETRTKDSFRPPGSAETKVSESTLRQRFQVSIWEVPGIEGVLRVETAPLSAGAKVAGEVVSASLADMPINVRYKTPDGRPSSYWGTPLDDLRPTTLVFPTTPVAPGDTWKRQIPANQDFELPIEVTFRFLHEGRKEGRLCAEIEMEATAGGNLPENRGVANLKITGRFLFDIRLGRVLESRSRLYQTMIGRIGEGQPPAKRKIEETTELSAGV